MNDRDGFKRAADTALEIFRSKARLVAVIGLAGLGAWPIVKLTMKLNDQSAQGNPALIQGDSFVAQLGARGNFSVVREDGTTHRSKYVAVNGYATLVEEKENGQNRFGETRRQWYKFEPVSTNLVTLEPAQSAGQTNGVTNGFSLSTTNASDQLLNTNLFPSTNSSVAISALTNSPKTSIVVSMNVDSIGELVGGDDVDAPRGSHPFPVCFTLSKANGFHRIKEDVPAPGITNTTHVFRCISVSWGTFAQSLPPSTLQKDSPKSSQTKTNSSM